jgi:hypothetical protein
MQLLKKRLIAFLVDYLVILINIFELLGAAFLIYDLDDGYAHPSPCDRRDLPFQYHTFAWQRKPV